MNHHHSKSDSWRYLRVFNQVEDQAPILSVNVKQLEVITSANNSFVPVGVRVGMSFQVESFTISGDDENLILRAENGEKEFKFRIAGPQNIWEAYVGEESGSEIWFYLKPYSSTALTTLFAFYKEALG